MYMHLEIFKNDDVGLVYIYKDSIKVWQKRKKKINICWALTICQAFG